MDVERMLRSVKGVLENIPFDRPFFDSVLHIDPANFVNVPQHIRRCFNIRLIFRDNLPYNAACSIIRDERIFTIIMIFNKKFELIFDEYLKTNEAQLFDDVCFRRELYSHEVCHLLAVIQAYPNQITRQTGDDFVKKIEKKFSTSLNEAVTDPFISLEKDSCTPSDFTSDHFNYENDKTNYEEVFADLMVSDDKIDSIIDSFITNNTVNFITTGFLDSAMISSLLKDFYKNAFVSKDFIKRNTEKKFVIFSAIAKSYVALRKK